MDRARDGFRQLYEFISAAQTGVQPADGTFISIIRLLIRYPEILAWEQLWHESKESLKQEIYGEVKQIKPNASVRWHVYHWATWDPIYRAIADYSRMATYSDWIKPVVYHDVAGPRIKSSTIDPWTNGILRESSPNETLQMLYGILGYDRSKEPSYDQLSQRGLSPNTSIVKPNAAWMTWPADAPSILAWASIFWDKGPKVIRKLSIRLLRKRLKPEPKASLFLANTMRCVF